MTVRDSVVIMLETFHIAIRRRIATCRVYPDKVGELIKGKREPLSIEIFS